MDLSEKQQKISTAIMDYLKRNPQASDTLEGIFKWWLQSERIEASIDEVACILDNLVQLDLLIMRRQPNGLTFYKLNKTNL